MKRDGREKGKGTGMMDGGKHPGHAREAWPLTGTSWGDQRPATVAVSVRFVSFGLRPNHHLP
jgi:hypothetical protein